MPTKKKGKKKRRQTAESSKKKFFESVSELYPSYFESMEGSKKEGFLEKCFKQIITPQAQFDGND
jgi:hypothetical protein